MDISKILSRAGQITWKFKILWLFGILASCGGVGGGGNSGGGGGGNGSSSAMIHRDFNAYHNTFSTFLRALGGWLQEISPWVVFVLIVLACILIVFLIVLALILNTIGRIGLIQGTTKVEAGAERLGLSELFKGGLPYFWRVLVLTLLLGIGAVVAALFIGFPLGIMTCGLGFLLLVPFMWLALLWIEQASIAIVVDNLDIADALRKSWQLIVNNLVNMLVLSLILYLVLGLLVGMVLVIPVFVFLVPAILAGVMAAIADVPFILGTGVVVAIGFLVIYIPLAILISGILRTYIGSAWTLTYLELNKIRPMLEDMTVS